MNDKTLESIKKQLPSLFDSMENGNRKMLKAFKALIKYLKERELESDR